MGIGIHILSLLMLVPMLVFTILYEIGVIIVCKFESKLDYLGCFIFIVLASIVEILIGTAITSVIIQMGEM
ncbi:hypothetical protein BCPG3_071 [Bacillus phage BCPG3]|uniref:Uncharacterized protein n=2 Tax=Wphvirus BPS13 TaxID=1987727 RepID=A0A173GBF8_9CAUD|nr:hypothetical protein BPS13_0065 [Bacillus phage BPS13]YP_009281962.1 hypothetical protein SALINJAH_8 [Bacillus phage SalinJah]QQO38930.1 hypothetical protein BCPG1_199 [Bacillus phage BCPG1]QSJ04388.1 hypothetical protein BCPG3_071 [Bacillus phage BCPG3]QSJ04602.1 hypothetical protein BCP18_070 [Bacillus phage BCP18]AEZ50244.1 hypothetical protein BPS13_0065 [Bacillus phage BPS13]ANH50656.1 hypothetical protein SALINJAH_8 [Bacillus phage SalinJah]